MSGHAATRALDIIERNAALQSRLIEDLLQVSQIVSGKLQLEVEALDLATLLHASVETLRPAATAKAITLECQVDSHVPAVLGDPTRVQQIIWNVLSNALKFTPRDGIIAATLKQDGPAVEISITDSGAGIELAVLPHIFDWFRQGDGSVHRAVGGLGLGLAIVRRLMELHGGTVRGESAGFGRGSTFTLRFPALTANACRDHSGRIKASLCGLRMLVVEDAPDSRDLMVALLSGSGAQVTAVSTAYEAIAEVTRRVPDLLIADIGLPDQDGYELIRHLKRVTGAKRFPAVALTAYAQPHHHDRALAAGFDLHISKPVHPAEFVTAIAALARRAEGGRD
jgi:CheY-like chemotaxis protein